MQRSNVRSVASEMNVVWVWLCVLDFLSGKVGNYGSGRAFLEKRIMYRTIKLNDFCGKLIHSFGYHCEYTLNSDIIYVCCTEHVQ